MMQSVPVTGRPANKAAPCNDIRWQCQKEVALASSRTVVQSETLGAFMLTRVCSSIISKEATSTAYLLFVTHETDFVKVRER